MISFHKDSLRTIPQTPGVYFFLNTNRKIIYIGKAVNLKMRLSSYFSNNLYGKTKSLVNNTAYLKYQVMPSEYQALLSESYLIKRNQPKYNVLSKDDKSPLFVCITKEEYPRLLLKRSADINKDDQVYGPFSSTRDIKKLLFFIRKIIPYSTHKLGSKPCFYHQMNLCDPCPNIIHSSKRDKAALKHKYRKNISLIKKILSGKSLLVINLLVKELEKQSSQKRFEEANTINKQITSLKRLFIDDNYHLDFEDPNNPIDVRKREIAALKTLLLPHFPKIDLTRIECFDVSHLFGYYPTASMACFLNGCESKSDYRHFKIKARTRSDDDISSLNEIAQRRTKHFTDWGKPGLIIVDGGKGQIRAFQSALNKYPEIPVIGLAKEFETIYIPLSSHKGFASFKPKGPALNLVQRLRDEAHRFARRYHQTLFKKALFGKNP